MTGEHGRSGALTSSRALGDERRSRHQAQAPSLADILERVLDKGIVIAGDIQINLLDIELLTIKLRLLVASVDRAREMGIDWWEGDPSLSGRQAAERGEPIAERTAGAPGAGGRAARGRPNRESSRSSRAPPGVSGHTLRLIARRSHPATQTDPQARRSRRCT